MHKCHFVTLCSTVFSFKKNLNLSAYFCAVFINSSKTPEQKRSINTTTHIHKTSYKTVFKLFLFNLENIFRRKNPLLVVGWSWLPRTHTAIFVIKEHPPPSFFLRLNNHSVKMFAWQLIQFSSSHFQPSWNFQYSWFFLLHHGYLH